MPKWNLDMLKTSKEAKLAKKFLDMLFSTKFPSVHTKNGIDNCSGSWKYPKSNKNASFQLKLRQ